jgi:RNA polymerase sigma-70 factor (ECF subfamily)
VKKAAQHPIRLVVAKPAGSRGLPPTAADRWLDAVYEQHVSTVARWARRLGGPGLDVEDVVQDVFMVALRRPGEFQGEAGVRTWLFRITNNIVRSRRRRDRVRRWLFRLHGPSAEDAIAPVTPLESIERRESAARLQAALDDIPDIYRTAFILYELEGLPCEEVSALVGADVRTVWVRLHRGRAKLLSALNAHEARRARAAPGAAAGNVTR